jgi:hypothetical protein
MRATIREAEALTGWDSVQDDWGIYRDQTMRWKKRAPRAPAAQRRRAMTDDEGLGAVKERRSATRSR